MGSDKAMEAAAARRLRRDDWIDGAIKVLSDGGVEALGVNALADRLKVTKGSFYWHFRDRDALLDAVVDTWRRRTTSEIEAFIRASVGSPAGRLRRLVRIAISPRLEVPGGPLEMTLRDWARRDARIAEIVREVDDRRLAFLEQLYKEAGSDGPRARSLAVLHMSYVVGSRILLSGHERQDYEESWRIAERILVPGDQVYGLLCAPDGCLVAIEVFDGNTAVPMTLAVQVDKLKQRFQLDHVALVGDRGMITQVRITEG